MTAYKRAYRAGLPSIVRSYFEAFFMYAELKESPSRFDPLWTALREEIAKAVKRL